METLFNPQPVITPPGLSAERAWYLYDQIRQHCGEAGKDETCPLPSEPRINSTSMDQCSSSKKRKHAD